MYLLNYAGPIAVNLFFVISGFLIAGSLIHNGSIREFAKNRFLRIYPVFLTIHLLIFAVGPFIGYKWMKGISNWDYVSHFLSNAFMLPGIFPLPIAQIVAWSLSYELVFYIIAALIWVVQQGRRLPQLAKYTAYVAIAILCGILIYYRTDMLFFAVGVALYVCKNRLPEHGKQSAAFYFNGFIYFGGMLWAYSSLETPIIAVLPISFAFFIDILSENGLLSLLLRTRVMHYLGRISFSLYMWHTMVMFGLKIIAPKISAILGYQPFWIYALLSLSLSIVVSDFSYWIIERWCTDRLRRNKKPPL